MASFSSEVQLATVATAANCSIYNVMFDLDEALDPATYFSTDDDLGEEAATDESKLIKSNPEPLLVSTLPVVSAAAGSGGAAAAGCSVCMESFGPAGSSEGRQIPCGHVYHAACIATWVSMYDSCPLCRCKVSSS